MSHLEKYKAAACPGMLHHYRRDRQGVLDRENVDASRTHLNYVIGPADYGWEEVARRAESVSKASGRKVRKDAVVMADVVVTRPQNVPEGDERAFFQACYDYLVGEVGQGNVLGCWVHMDETTPHMHFAFTPILDGRFNFKKLCHKGFYQRYHSEMQAHCKSVLGYEPRILLDEGQVGDKQLSRLSQAEYVASKARLAELGSEVQEQTERLESVQAAVEGVEQGRAAARRGFDQAVERAEQALAAADRVSRECSSAAAASFKGPGVPSVAESRAREGAARAACVELRDRVRALGERLGELRERLAGLVRDGFKAWGLWSEFGRGVAHPIAQETYPAPADLAALLEGARSAVQAAPRVGGPTRADATSRSIFL